MRWGRTGLLGLAACSVFGAEDPPPEDPSQPPVEGTPLVGVFVSSSRGADDGDGSRERPLKTLEAAFARAKETGQRVIACAEAFPEKLDLVDGVSAYGNYDCNAEWAKTERRAEIASPAEVGVVAREIVNPTRIEGFRITSADLGWSADDPLKRTSIGVYVADSKNLVFANVVVIAGAGADGVDGSIGPNDVEESTATGGRNAGSQSTQCPFVSVSDPFFCETAGKRPGAAGGWSRCKSGIHGGPGGAGGDGAHEPNWSDPTEHHSGRPFQASPQTALGGVGAPLPGSVAKGGPGSHGAPGQPGADGTNGVGRFDLDGFHPGDGTAGEPGGPGQGGGGGGGNGSWRLAPDGAPISPPGGFPSTTGYWAANGAGGGAGGCGGLPGEPGRGGGASIGMFVVRSAVTVRSSEIASSRGGRAGVGHVGHIGLPGGSGGAGSDWGGAGGNGGSGGPSGISGSGSAGPSYALVFTGDRPLLEEDVKLLPGPGGEGVPMVRKAVPGFAAKTLPAVPAGESAPEHSF